MIEISSACVFEEFDFGFKKKKKLYSTLKIESADFAIHFSYIYVCVCVWEIFSLSSALLLSPWYLIAIKH